MSNVITSGNRRHELIKETCLAWFEISPGMAQEFKRYVDEITAAQYKKSGSWRTKEGGYYNMSFPADLWYSLRRVLPDFGDDDADIGFLCQEFPDIFKSNKFNIKK